MKRFDFIQPATVAEALKAWHPGAAWLGGGTNLLDLMKGGVMQPDTVIDINRLADLRGITALDDGAVRIGALVSNADLAHDADFARDFPMVAEALLSGASGQLRNAATVAGNLMQRTRCAYFQDTTAACNRRAPGTGCDARGGVDSHTAVLGFSDGCITTHPSDFCVPLAALDAVIEVQGPTAPATWRCATFTCCPERRRSVRRRCGPERSSWPCVCLREPRGLLVTLATSRCGTGRPMPLPNYKM